MRLNHVKGGEEEAMKKLSPGAKPQSVLNNVTFKDIIGGEASAISLHDSELIVVGEEQDEFISKNVAIFGSPIRLNSNSTLSIVR